LYCYDIQRRKEIIHKKGNGALLRTVPGAGIDKKG
jgi:hypothetical protein